MVQKRVSKAQQVRDSGPGGDKLRLMGDREALWRRWEGVLEILDYGFARDVQEQYQHIHPVTGDAGTPEIAERYRQKRREEMGERGIGKLSDERLRQVVELIFKNPGEALADLTSIGDLFQVKLHLAPHLFMLLHSSQTPDEDLKRITGFAEAMTAVPLRDLKPDRRRMGTLLYILTPPLVFRDDGKIPRTGDIPERTMTAYNAMTDQRMGQVVDEIVADDGNEELCRRLQIALHERPERVLGVLNTGASMKGFLMAKGWKDRVPEVTEADMLRAVKAFVPGARPSGTVAKVEIDSALPEPSKVQGNTARYSFGREGSVTVYAPVFDNFREGLDLRGVVGERGKRFLEMLTWRRASGEYEDIFPVGTDLPYYEQFLANDRGNRGSIVCSQLATFRRHLITTRFDVPEGNPTMIHSKVAGDDREHYYISEKEFGLASRAADRLGAEHMLRPVMAVELPWGEYNLYGQPRRGEERILFFEYEDCRRILESFPTIALSPEFVRNVGEWSGRPVDDIVEDMIVKPFGIMGQLHAANMILYSDSHLGNYMLTRDGGVKFVSDFGSAKDVFELRAFGHDDGRITGLMEGDVGILAECFNQESLRTTFRRLGFSDERIDELVEGGREAYGSSFR